ncbi:MAG TPA: ABC transporter ATP-binding protein [Candidatus Glassbacteria bacterium]|nr:ABC transporter ATP-binding protein [Candidatus Glassbacteria bacterium]
MYLQIDNITKKFASLTAIDSVSLNLETNKILVLVGVNGSGKTTMLRLLAGLEEPDTGSIIINKSIKEANELRQLSTLVFQKTVMFNRTVYSNLEFGLKIRGNRKDVIDKRICEVLKIVGLEGFENRNAKKISGGEQQRVALARAFLLEPKILLLDEPTSNLDVNSAKIIEKVIQNRKRSDTIIVLSTHNLYQAKRLGDEIVHIHEGKIINQAKTKDFFSNPKHKITEKFIKGDLQF